ncbi:MAG: 1,4-dihydroxy-2-naphthoate polyprenyltransferase [Spirochaetaceae bacterium]|nr:1,4-dihydroxy-2-naphthoate polyprenyltransferase [Spirochaetaceae bacterium]
MTVAMAEPPAPALTAWWLAIRPRTLWAAVAPVLAGSALALWHGSLAVPWALVALAGALLIQVGCNLHNDWADARHGADTAERVGPTRVTQAGLIPPRQVLGGALAMFAGAAALGVAGVARAGWPLAVLLAACVVAAISYTGGPRLGYLGLGDLLVLVFFGPVAVGATYYLQTLALPALVLGVGLGPGLLATAILVVNNLRDRATDEQAGKRTLAVRFGDRFARAEYLVCLLAGVLLPPILLLAAGTGGAAWPALLPLLTLIPALRVHARLRATPAGPALNPLLATTARVLLLQALLLMAGASAAALLASDA